MQHKFKIGQRGFLAVGVPVDTNKTDYYRYTVNLPFDFKILFEWPNCTEEQAASVVDKDGGCYECYTDHKIYFEYAKESLASKMEAEGLYIENPYMPVGVVYEDGSNIDQHIKWSKAQQRVHDKYLILEITTR